MLYLTKNIQICRCDYRNYEQFESLHYLDGICKGAACYLFKVNGLTAAFASLLALPMKNHSDAMIFHRVVVLEQFQKLGLSSLIVNFIGSIYKASGKNLYIKTDSKRMGKMLRNNSQWTPTQMNLRTRKLSKPDHARNKARHRRAAFCYKFIGEPFRGFEAITQPIDIIRDNRLLNKCFNVDTLSIAKITYNLTHTEFLRDALSIDFEDLRCRYGSKFKLAETPQNLYTITPHIRYNPVAKSQSFALRVLFLNGIITRSQREMSVEATIFHLLLENQIQSLKLSNRDVIRVALRVIKTDIAQYSDLLTRQPSYTINKEVAKQRGYSPKQASNIARKEIRTCKIAELYNPDLSDNDNLTIMAKKGLSISLSTLKRWRKENGYNKYNKSVIPMT